MLLTRATDNRLKTFFLGGEVRFGATALQGKGFRSLGQEAIYGAAMRLRRGAKYRNDSSWTGDVIGPMIRDLGATLAMRPEPATVRMVLNSQMGKAGPPTDGKDFGYGDLDWGILLPASPLTIATTGSSRR
jgi:TPP-dependent pyruvate/acetoin dehydrogenase alpha subunit